MKPRCVIIGVAPDLPLAGFASTLAVAAHPAAIRLRTVGAKQEKSFHVELKESARTLTTLMEAAWQLDWQREVSRREADFRAHGFDLGVLLKASPSDIESMVMLQGPDTSENLQLRSVAKIVHSPRTVFVLGALDDASRRLMRALASELKDMTVEELVKNRFCFAPLSDDDSSTKAIAELIDLAVGSWTGTQLSEFEKRPGPVLLTGPTGSGKTELAKQLGNAGDGEDPLKINIGALTEGLLESRLRGFAKGSHSKADKDTPGCFEQANGGTLFFDEFQNASPAAQVQLLDLLSAVSDEIVISRMGEDVPRRCRVKVVLAANEPLSKLLEEGRLRHDLYHRVRIVHEMPSLAARLRQEGEGDKLLKRLMTIYRWKSNRPVTLSDTIQNLGVLFPRYDSDILQALKAHSWPGNLRELERVCFDLSWKLEQTGEAGLAFLRRLLHRFDLPDATREPPAASQAASCSPELARLRRLEVILLEHDLDPVAAAVRLGEVRLKTPHHMRKFLRKHEALLSSKFLEHPRAKRLLKRRISKRLTPRARRLG